MTPTYDGIITSFTTYLQNIGYNPKTAKRLPVQVKSFFVYHNLSDPKAATQEQILRFYDWLHTKPNERRGGGISDSHIHHHLYALRTFFTWLEHTGQIRANPISALTFKPGEKKTREPLSSEEIKALFAATITDRERAMLHLLYSCGLRRAEAVMLDTGDVHFKARMLYVRRGKGCKRRAIPITERVAEALECYLLAERSTAVLQKGFGYTGHRHPTAFMLNKTGGRMSGGTCNELVHALRERAGIAQIVTPHYLRHSIATHLLEAGVPIEQVKDFLGHSNLEATQLYAKVYSKQLRNL